MGYGVIDVVPQSVSCIFFVCCSCTPQSFFSLSLRLSTDSPSADSLLWLIKLHKIETSSLVHLHVMVKKVAESGLQMKQG